MCLRSPSDATSVDTHSGRTDSFDPRSSLLRLGKDANATLVESYIAADGAKASSAASA